MGHSGAAGERQKDPSEDQAVQDQARSDEALVPGGEGEADTKTGLFQKRLKCNLNYYLLQDEEPFNPDYVEVDRILDVSHSVDKDNGEVRNVFYLSLKRSAVHLL